MTWRKKEIAEQVEQDNKEPLKVVFVDGCFDEFDGTQEELDELIKTIEAKVADGSIFTESRPLDEEQDPEVIAELLARMERAGKRTLN